MQEGAANMKKTTYILVSILIFLTGMFFWGTESHAVNDAPHIVNSGLPVPCAKCHFSSKNMSTSLRSSISASNPQINAVCLTTCHNSGKVDNIYMRDNAGNVQTHSSYNTSTSHNGGNPWVIGCNTCHNPHYQRQSGGLFASDPMSSIVTGSVVSLDGSNLVLTIINPSVAMSTNQFVNYMLIPNMEYPGYMYRIAANGASTITIVSDPKVPTMNPSLTGLGKTFTIKYGKMIKDQVATPHNGTKAVKFFNNNGQNSFADGDGVIDGICQVCHTETHSYTNFGSMASPTAHQGDNQQPGNNCLTEGCHSHVEGFKKPGLNCVECHGNPPSADTTGYPGVAGGITSTRTYATSLLSGSAGAHVLHSGTSGLGMKCYVCHSNTTMYQKDKESHSIQMGIAAKSENFPMYPWSGPTVSTGYFTGYLPLNTGFSWTAASGLTISYVNNYPAANICGNMYCHGGGTPGAAQAVPALTGGTYTRPQWTASIVCGNCHGASYSNPPTAGSHKKHVVSNITCDNCHGAGYSSTTNIYGNGHVNGVVNWNLDINDKRYGNGAAYKLATTGATTYLAMGGTYGSCANIYCHSDALGNPPNTIPTWGQTLSADCSGCHGGNTTAAYSMSSSPAHSAHINNISGVGKLIGCTECHNATVLNDRTLLTGTNHANYAVNIKFNNSAGLNLDNDYPKYNNNSTTVASGASKTPMTSGYVCSNVYCHSIGNLSSSSGTGSVVPAGGFGFLTPDWSVTGISCDGCHGGGGKSHPQYVNGGAGTMSANTHTKHVDNSGLGCAYCHVNTVGTNTTTQPNSVLTTGTPSHLNRVEDVSFLTVAGKSGNYSFGAKTCANTYCHGSSATWGGASLGCAGCHEASSNLSSGQTNSNRHSLHYALTTTATTTTAVNSSTTGSYVYNCGVCHSSVGHTNGSTDVAFNVSWATNTTGGNFTAGSSTLNDSKAFTYSQNNFCSNVYCHSDGLGSFKTVTWNQVVASPNCGICHQTTPTTGKHTKHLVSYSAFDCKKCHAATVSNNTTIGDKTKHVNAVRDVSFDSFASSGTGTYPSSSAGCQNIYCHSDGLSSFKTVTWGATLTCNGCHGGSATSAPSSTAHAKHVQSNSTNAKYLFSCQKCHAATVYSTVSSTYLATIKSFTMHVDKTKNVDLDANDSLVKRTSASIPSDSAATCSNVYCHSIGNMNVTTVGTSTTAPGMSPYPVFATPNWADSGLGCNGCHGRNTSGWPDYNTGGDNVPTSNSHILHSTAKSADLKDITCDICHADTAMSNTQLNIIVSPSKHVNGITSDIVFSGYASGGTYTAGNKSCTNQCHSAGHTWGGASGCTSCHGYPPVDANGMTSPGTNTTGRQIAFPVTPWGAHNVHWTKVNGAIGNCYACHTGGMTSSPGDNKFQMGFSATLTGTTINSGAYSAPAMSGGWSIVSGTIPNTTVNITGVGTPRLCSNLYCHSSGAGTASQAKWDDTNINCDYCHTSTNMATAKHSVHVDNTYDNGSKCTKCHNTTVATDSAISVQTNHVNGKADVSWQTSFVGATGDAYSSGAACTNIYCHSKGTTSYSAPLDTTFNWAGDQAPLDPTPNKCKLCHGGNADDATVTANMPVGSHTRHIGTTAGYSLTCDECHAETVASGSSTALNATTGAAKHVNKVIDWKFSASARGSLINQSTGTYETSKICTNTYCHSSGTSFSSTFGAPAQNAATWGVVLGAADKCRVCHGTNATSRTDGVPEYGNGAKANSHGKHVISSSTGYLCVDCHSATVNSSNLIISTAKHVNGSYDVSGTLFTSFSPSTTGGTCLTYCHGVSAKWGGAAFDCAGCHEASSKLTSVQTSSNRHNLHYATTTTALSTAAGNSSTVGSYVYNCGTCHYATNHAKGYADSGKGIAADVNFNVVLTGGTSTGVYYSGSSTLFDSRNFAYSQNNTCNNVYCHSNGLGTFTTVTWNQAAASPNNCGVCHEATPTTNRHGKHVVSYTTIGCVRCHNATVMDNVTIDDKTKHINAVRDVSFDSVASSSTSSAAYPNTATGCQNTYCHSNGAGSSVTVTWNTTLNTDCSGCHGGNSTATGGKIATNAHNAHINSAPAVGRKIGCAECHGATVSTDTTIATPANHVNKLLNVKFDNNGVNKDNDNPTYNGMLATGLGATANPNSQASCNNVYCHSIGNLLDSTGSGTVVPAGGQSFKLLSWNTTTIGCDGCHGGGGKAHPQYVNGGAGTMSANTHTKHVDNSGLGCAYCHVNTVGTATVNQPTAVLTTATPSHLNRVEDVNFLTVAGASGSYDFASKTCSATYCHGSSATWGGASLDCAGCHEGSSNLSSGQTNSNRHNLHYALTSTATSTTAVNNSVAGSYVYNCGVCHSAVGHTNGTLDVSFNVSWATGTTGGNFTTGASITKDSKGFSYSQNNVCNNVYCHSNGLGTFTTVTWNQAAASPNNCGVCHSAQPTTGKHGKHTVSYSLDCVRCHYATVLNSTTVDDKTKHINGVRDVSFDSWVSSMATYTTPAVGCANTYCHSKGVVSTSPTHSAVNWTTTTTTCKSCHGGENGSARTDGVPQYANPSIFGGVTKSNSHQAHVISNNQGCQKCHSATTTNGTTIAVASNHANKAWDLQQGLGTNEAFSVVTQGSPTTGAVTSCNNIGCHGGTNTATWGNTLNCIDCHGTSGADVDDFNYNSFTGLGSDGTTAVINNAEWIYSGHGRTTGTYPVTSNQAANFSVVSAGGDPCLYCHTSGVSHSNASNPFRLIDAADYTQLNNNCLRCHTTAGSGYVKGTTGPLNTKKASAATQIGDYHYGAKHNGSAGGYFCWDCHDPHGDNSGSGNIAMIHSVVAKRNDKGTANQMSMPTVTVAVVFTSDTTWGGFVNNTSNNGVCQVCHTSLARFNGASNYDAGHNNTQSCTTSGCHVHEGASLANINGDAFPGGESTGGQSCNVCHTDFFPSDSNTTQYSMHSTKTGINYKHFMNNTNPAYITTMPTGTTTDPNRRCVMCHVDHDLFSVPSNRRGFNLKTSWSGTTAGTNTDFDASLPNGGICMSCHGTVSQVKAVEPPNGESIAPAIPFSGLTSAQAVSIVANSTHGYSVQSGTFKDGTYFNAVCVKCHNDTIGENGETDYKSMKKGQGSFPRFGEHQSTSNSSFAIMGQNFYQGVASSGTQSTITTAATWSTDQWVGYALVITSGSGSNQRVSVVGNNTTGVITVAPAFATGSYPTVSSTFDIVKSPISTDDVCFSCHSKKSNGQKSIQSRDWYGAATMKPSLEGMKDLFVGDSGTSASTSTKNVLYDPTKNWTASAWIGYTLRLKNGTYPGKSQRITNNTNTSITTANFGNNAIGVARYEILKPAIHPLDTYGRHNAYERVSPSVGWNKGDSGADTGASANTILITDSTKQWSSNAWAGMYVVIPSLKTANSVTSTYMRQISSSGTGSLSIGSGLSFTTGASYYITSDPDGVGGRHVSCGDCHNTHAAAANPEGAVDSFTLTTITAADSSDAEAPGWVANKWVGFNIRVRSKTTNLEQIRQITAFDYTQGKYTVSQPWSSLPAADDTYEVMMSDQWTTINSKTGLAGSGSSGVWGVTASGFNNTKASGTAAGTLQNTSQLSYVKVENVYDISGSRGGNPNTKQRDLCVKCHSFYSYGTAFPTTPSGVPFSTTASANAPSTDVLQEFSPNNVAHHAVFARGNNQPITANGDSTSATKVSVWNKAWPAWPSGSLGSADSSAVKVTITTAGLATFTTSTGAAANLPSTVLPGWVMYVNAANALTTLPTTSGATVTKGWFEISQIGTSGANTAYVTPVPLSTYTTATFKLTAGLGNAFVPPYGPWSVIRCTDCHGSTKKDPVGPHASVNLWLIKDADVNLRFEWMSSGLGTSPTVTTINYQAALDSAGLFLNQSNDTKYVCFNCHRADVYGTEASAKAENIPNNEMMGRILHGTSIFEDGSRYAVMTTVYWKQFCRHCHGGDKLGGIHGTNMAWVSATGNQPVPQGIRFLNGASWQGGLKRPTTTVLGTCYTGGPGNLATCSGQHNGSGIGISAGYAAYDYNGY